MTTELLDNEALEGNQSNAEDASTDAFGAAFDEFAETGGIAEVAEAPDDRPRDEQGRFTKADGPGEEEESLPEAAQISEAPDEQSVESKPIDWEHRYKSEAGRQRALQRKIEERDQLIQQLQSGKQEQSQAAQAENPESSGMSEEQWNVFKEDFPEIAEMMTANNRHYEQQLQQQQQVIDGLRNQIQPIQQQAGEQYQEAQYQLLEKKHPDYQDIADSTEFQYWMNQQPKKVQELINSDDAADAAYLLSAYKREKAAEQPQTNELEQRRKRKLAEAQIVPGRGGNKKPVAEDDFDAAFDHYAEKM